MKGFRVFIILFCVSFSSLCFADTPSGQNTGHLNFSVENLDAAIHKALKMTNVPGAAVGLVIDHQVVLLRGYGNRDLAQGLPVTEKTLFSIASCTKAFTTFILGQLVDEGKLEWDDPVLKHIPEFRLFDPELTARVTIRDLASHRVGLFRNDALWILSKISRNEVLGRLQYLEPTSKLREKFEYSNLLYSVAGIVIERVTGQTWEEAVCARIFTPLRMGSSNTDIEELQRSPDFSLPFAEIDGKATALPFRSIETVNPGGGINSNVTDMVKWIQLQLSEGKIHGSSLIRKETWKEMHAIQTPFPYSYIKKDEACLLGYGLGWFLGTYRGSRLIGHMGHHEGFFSDVSLLPDEKIGLVILTNSSTDGGYFITSVRNIIFDQLLGAEEGNWLKKAEEVRKKAKQNLKETAEGQTIEPSLNSLEPYTGYYEHPAYGIVQIHSENGRLAFSYGDDNIPLTYLSDDVFKGKIPVLLNYGVNPFVTFSFFKNSLGEIDDLHIPFESFRSAKPIVFKRANFN